MNLRSPNFGILLVCGLAFLTAGCVSGPTRAAQVVDFHTYGIIAADDRGILSPAELDRIQIGVVQYLVSERYVHSGQVFVPDIRQADIVFRVTIAWQGTGDSFAVVDVAPAFGGVATAGASPGAPVYSEVPYEPEWDDYYDYPDFGYAYEPYVPLIGIAPFFPFLGHPYHGRSYHPGDRDRDRDHRVPWRRDDHRQGSVRRQGDRPPPFAPPPLRPRGSDSDKHRPPPGAWHPRNSGPGPRPPADKPPARPPDRPGPGPRPPSHRPDRDGHRPPPPDHRAPPAVITPQPPSPNRIQAPAAVTSRRPPSDRRIPPAAVAPPPPPPARVSRPPPPDPRVRQFANRPADPPRAQRMEAAGRSSQPAPSRAEASGTSHRSDSGSRASSPPPSRGDSHPSSSNGDSDRNGHTR